MDENEITWADLDEQFGRTEVGIIDYAISAALAKHENGIKREDFFLASEGLTYAVLMAMRERGLRFQPVVQPIR